MTAPDGIDVVRAAFDAYQRGDEPAMFALVSEDVVARQFPDQLDVRDYRGHAGLREMMAAWIGTWDDWSIELLSAWEVGGLVFASAYQRGRGSGSGVPMQAEVTFVFEVHEGRIDRWRMFRSEREALDAVAADAQA